MKMQKRFLSLSLAVAMAASIGLSGCGSEGKEATNSSTATSTAATSTVAEATKSTLDSVELNWYLPAAPQKDTALVEKAIGDYLKDKINVTLKLNLVDWGSWTDKSQVLLAAGDNVDIMFTAGWSKFAQSVAKGYFADITDLLPKYAPKTVENLPKLLFEGAKVNGKVYAIPTSKEIAHTNGIIYSTDLAAKFGLTDALKAFETKMPTIDDLEPILKTAHEKDPTIYPLAATQNGKWALSFLDFDPIGDQNVPGVLYPNKDTKVINEYETPEYKALLETLHKYYKAGYIRKDAATTKTDTSDRKAQKIFLMGGTTKPLGNEEVGASYGYKMDMFSVTKPFITMNDTQGSMNAVVTTSKNPERALMFLEYVNSDATVNNMLNYGVENTHWVKKGDNVVDFAPGLDAKTTGYNPNAFWEFGNQFLNYFTVGQNTTKWEKFKEYNDSGVPSKILGFNFDAEPVKTEIAAVTNVIAELGPVINTGTVDPNEYLPKLNEKMKAAGLDKIIAEKQRQIDAWLAATKK